MSAYLCVLVYGCARSVGCASHVNMQGVVKVRAWDKHGTRRNLAHKCVTYIITMEPSVKRVYLVAASSSPYMQARTPVPFIIISAAIRRLTRVASVSTLTDDSSTYARVRVSWRALCVCAGGSEGTLIKNGQVAIQDMYRISGEL